MNNGTIIQGVDTLDIISFLNSKNKRIQATFLAELETVVPKDSIEFKKIRKLFLDATNNFKRAVYSSTFGDVEG